MKIVQADGFEFCFTDAIDAFSHPHGVAGGAQIKWK